MKIPGTQSEYEQVYKNSIEDPEQFWSDVAEDFTWKKKMEQNAGVGFSQTRSKMVCRWKIEYYRKLHRPAFTGQGQ